MVPSQVTKDLIGTVSEVCNALGFDVKIVLTPQDRPLDFDVYYQKIHQLTLLAARAERHVRAGHERFRFARGPT